MQGEPNCAKPQAVTLHYCLASHSHTAKPAQCTVKANLLGGTHLVVAGMATAILMSHCCQSLCMQRCSAALSAPRVWCCPPSTRLLLQGRGCFDVGPLGPLNNQLTCFPAGACYLSCRPAKVELQVSWQQVCMHILCRLWARPIKCMPRAAF